MDPLAGISAINLDWLDQPLLHLGEAVVTPAVLIKLILYPILAYIVAHAIRVLIRKTLNRPMGLEPNVQNPAATLAFYVAFALGLATALNSAGFPVESLAVFFGAFGLGIGLGMQQVAQNFISGLIILVARPIRVQDWIHFQEIEGSVERIGVYSTMVRTLEDAEIVVPNSELVNSLLTNWTRNRRLRRLALPVGVAYDSDVRMVEGLLVQAAQENDGVVASPEPFVLLKAYGASSVDFDLLVWTEKFVETPDVLRSQLYFRIWELLQANRIEIPFTQIDLHVRSDATKTD